MTKEIIINNVDVAGCGYYNQKNDKGEWCDLTCERESATGFRCETMPNCYYKQLKRLEQENERLKEELEKIRNNKCVDCISHLISKNHKKALIKASKVLKTMQEIKEIAGFHITDTDSEDVQNNMKQILDLITKAESEG